MSEIDAVLDRLRDPRVSLEEFGYIMNQEWGQMMKVDRAGVCEDLFTAVTEYIANPPKDRDGFNKAMTLVAARQSTKSSTVEIAGYPLAAYTPGYNWKCIADTNWRADELHRRVQDLHDRWPERYRPKKKTSSETRSLTFAQGGHMGVLSAHKEGVGVGLSPDGFHGSEIFLWRNAAKEMSYIYPSMINRRNSLMVLEATPCTMDTPSGPYWKEHCMGAMHGGDFGRDLFIFIPYWKSRLNRREWRDDWKLEKEEERLLSSLGPFGLTRENLAFRRLMMSTDKEIRKNPELFDTYFPKDPVSCWLDKGSGVIHHSLLSRFKADTMHPWDPPSDRLYRKIYRRPTPGATIVIGVDPVGWGARDHGSYHIVEVWDGHWEQIGVVSGVGDPTELFDMLKEDAEAFDAYKIGVERNGPGEGFLAMCIKLGLGPRLHWEKGRPGVWKVSDDQMFADMLDPGLKSHLVLNDQNTLLEVRNYKNDKKIQATVTSEMINPDGTVRRRRSRSHWDKVSALAVTCTMAKKCSQRRPPWDTVSGAEPVKRFTELTWNERQEWIERVKKEEEERRLRIKAARRSRRRRRR